MRIRSRSSFSYNKSLSSTSSFFIPICPVLPTQQKAPGRSLGAGKTKDGENSPTIGSGKALRTSSPPPPTSK